ncbi:unnamed protein product [Heterobilharzia americana]|nr:unnamed protein product [Heterobilharzia americana]
MNSNKIIKVNRKLAILKQKEENELLETETKEIEKRLNLLKSTLYSEICKKSNASDSEPIWKSSHSSFTVNKPKSDALIDVSKIKFKTLKHNPLSKNKPPDVFGDVIRKIADLNKKVPGCSTDHGQLQCGQCEDKRAVVSCQECSEYYCAKCFASFHMKGALRRHHSLPISTSTPRFESLQSKHFNESSQSTSCEKAVSIGCQSSFGASDKLNAELQTEDTKTMKQNQFFDNKQSLTLSKRSSTPVVGCNVSTLCRSPVPIEIHFTPSISYAEKLLLRLHRNSKLQQLGSQISTNHQTMSMEMIQGQSNSEEHTMQDFKLDRISFNELHKLATSEVQLNGTLALYPTNDLEPSTPQLNEIMSSGGDEFNYNRLHENLKTLKYSNQYNILRLILETNKWRTEQNKYYQFIK